MFAFPGIFIRDKDLTLDAGYRFKRHGQSSDEILEPAHTPLFIPVIRFNFLPGRRSRDC